MDELHKAFPLGIPIVFLKHYRVAKARYKGKVPKNFIEIYKSSRAAELSTLSIKAQLASLHTNPSRSLSDTLSKKKTKTKSPKEIRLEIARLKEIIDTRKCCELNGRAGDIYCGICGKTIPDEMILND